MKLNKDKCHLTVSGYKNEHICVKIRTDVKHLVINIENEQTFDVYILKICSQVIRSDLAQMQKLISFRK